MPPSTNVSIASTVIERLKAVDDGATGSLFGITYDNNLFVLGFGLMSKESCFEPWNSLPSEVQVLGAFTVAPESDKAETYLSDLPESVSRGNDFLLLTDVKANLQCHSLNDGSFAKVSFSILSSHNFSTTFMYLHIKAEFIIDSERSSEGIKSAFEEIRKKVMGNDVAFLLPIQKLFVSSDKVCSEAEISPNHRLKDLIDSQPERGNREFDIIPAQIHLKQTKDLSARNVQRAVPFMRHVRCSFESVNIKAQVDVLALVHRNNKVAVLFPTLANSFVHGLRLTEGSLIEQMKLGKLNPLSTPEIFHFLPPQSNLFITVAYPKKSSDSDLKRMREQLHQSFGFARDQPLFRRSQVHKVLKEKELNGPLTNPHDGLNSGVKGGQSYLVKGLYHYHHYMQNRFDDNGWGCAYRSLQTIVSWFRLQGYTEVQVPTHKQIQECLVKIGDKPSSFIGSRQWIGSTEVSFVLETLLGVSCRILTASTGEEVGSLGSELSYHFQTHGTPIMIGGGVLAHTIIGVDYNRSTGDIKFLILDPHYTGGEDIGVITGKGWVGWKDIKFWTKNAFYNLCLPLRPIGDV